MINTLQFVNNHLKYLKSGSLQLEKAYTYVIHTQIIFAIPCIIIVHCPVTINLHLRNHIPTYKTELIQVLIKLR